MERSDTAHHTARVNNIFISRLLFISIFFGDTVLSPFSLQPRAHSLCFLLPFFTMQNAWMLASFYIATGLWNSYFNQVVSLGKATWECKMSCRLKKINFSGSLHYTICSFLTFLWQTNFLDSEIEPRDGSTGFSKVLNNPNFSFTGIRINCSAFSLLWCSYLPCTE